MHRLLMIAGVVAALADPVWAAQGASSVSARSIKELVALAKAKPGQLNYA